jgi:nitrogen fixation NifU-like protein
MTHHERDSFEDFVLAEIESPWHYGRLDRPTCVRILRNPACGDQVRLELLIDVNGRVLDAQHEARGCLVCRAAASHLCCAIEGRTVSELRRESPEVVVPLLQLPLTPLRRQCALLPFATLRLLVDGIQ